MISSFQPWNIVGNCGANILHGYTSKKYFKLIWLDILQQGAVVGLIYVKIITEKKQALTSTMP